MRYTVMGASGFVGRRLVQSLRQDGAEVFEPVRNDPALFERDLGRVFYCVGMTADFAHDPSATIESHAGLLSRLIDRARLDRIIYLSSTRLYDNIDASVGDGSTMLRIDPANPRSLSDLTKALGENLCRSRLPDRSCVARLSGVFDWTIDAPGFLSQWFQRAAREKTFVLDSAAGSVRDYIHLDDTVRALRVLMDSELCGTVNVASGENVSNSEIEAVFNAHGWSITCRTPGERQVLPVCNIDALLKLGCRPKLVRHAVADWIKETQKS